MSIARLFQALRETANTLVPPENYVLGTEYDGEQVDTSGDKIIAFFPNGNYNKDNSVWEKNITIQFLSPDVHGLPLLEREQIIANMHQMAVDFINAFEDWQDFYNERFSVLVNSPDQYQELLYSALGTGVAINLRIAIPYASCDIFKPFTNSITKVC